MPTAEQWAQEFSRATDGDPEIGAHGKYYSCSYMLDMEQQKIIVDMHRGKVEKINLDPAPLDSYDFALRAPAATARRDVATAPPPRVPTPSRYGHFWSRRRRCAVAHPRRCGVGQRWW